MISVTVMGETIPENGRVASPDVTKSVIYRNVPRRQLTGVLTTVELLARLEERGVKNADIARAINVTPSRITEMKKGERAIKLDEAATLVSAFGLEEPGEPEQDQQPEPPLPSPIARLVVRYIAAELGSELSDEQVAELGEDVRAFVQFVADPNVADPIRAAEDFFRMIRIRRTSPEPTDRG